jgi:GR25 family glycosyltransferase involved in LPS biosynthesis
MIKIDKIYCLNLPSRKDRLEKMQEQFSRLSLDVEIVPGVIATKEDYNPFKLTLGHLGCVMGRRNILIDAIKKNYDQILILEDDIVLCDDFHERLNEYSYQLPNDWDEAYLGAIRFPKHGDLSQVSENVYENYMCFGTQAIILKNTIFDYILMLCYEGKSNADNIHAENTQKRFKSFVFKPYFFSMNNDYSDISKAMVKPEFVKSINDNYKNKLISK